MQKSVIQKSYFGKLKNGEKIACYEFKNANGVTIHLLSYGLTIQKMLVPDREGTLRDVVLGFDDIAGYESEHPYFGCLVGRNANRIKNGQVVLDGNLVQLSQNEGNNQLHSGAGFQRKVWECEIKEDTLGQSFLECFYEEKDGEEGFPGNLKTTVTFQLTNENVLDMRHTATTDATTVVNLTRHDYFNLKDGGASSILEHEVQIHAQQITETDAEGIPTGNILPIRGTSYDFGTNTQIQANLNKKNPDLLPIAFDDNYVLEKAANDLAVAAKIIAPDGKRSIEIHTTQPGMQFYTGVHTKDQHGKSGVVYQPYSGLCLEGQHFPDAPNHPNFESSVLTEDTVYEERLQYHFGF